MSDPFPSPTPPQPVAAPSGDIVPAPGYQQFPGHEGPQAQPEYHRYAGSPPYPGQQQYPYPGPQLSPTHQQYAGQQPYPEQQQYAGHPQFPGQQYPGYQPYPQYPPRMPGAVRAAQVIAWLMGGAGLALVGVAIASGDAEFAGMMLGGFLIPLILAGLAFGFGSAGNGVRVTVLVLASLQTLAGFGGLATRMPPGLLGAASGILLICLLAQGQAQQWFSRPR